MDRIILHCDMNNFFASVECKNNPSIASKPVAVCGSSEDRHGIVLAKNYEAKKYGIQTGEPTVKALAKCPFLVTVEPHYDEYVKYSRLAKRIYNDYTDLVEPYGDDECWLDVTGSTLLFGSGENMAYIIKERIKNELGLTVSVGVSFNKVFAKLGSDMKKPDAVTVIDKENFRQKIWHLPASELIGVGPSSKKTLGGYGINTIGELANAYPPMLLSSLGKNGIRLIEIANGRDNDRVLSINESTPMKSVSRGMTTKKDLITSDEIRALIIALSQDIGHRLILRGKKASSIGVVLRDCNLFTRQCQKKLLAPTDSCSVLAKEAYSLVLEKMPINTPIRSVTVMAADITDASLPYQTDLFYDCSELYKREKLDRTVDGINFRFGRDKVHYAASEMTDFHPHTAFGFGVTQRADFLEAF